MEVKSNINELYNKIQQNKSIFPEYKSILQEFNILREEFDKKLSEQQQQELITLLQQMKDMCSIETKEYFIEGFKRGARLMIEVQ